jgi:hypothetical protein
MQRMRCAHEPFAPLSQNYTSDSKCGGGRLLSEQLNISVVRLPLFRQSRIEKKLTVARRARSTSFPRHHGHQFYGASFAALSRSVSASRSGDIVAVEFFRVGTVLP